MPRKTIGATAGQLDSSTAAVTSGVQLKAAAANSGTVYVGYASSVTANSAVATDGFPLAAGETYFVPKSKASTPAGIYVIASAADQNVFYDVQ
jgi:hypothetical protein